MSTANARNRLLEWMFPELSADGELSEWRHVLLNRILRIAVIVGVLPLLLFDYDARTIFNLFTALYAMLVIAAASPNRAYNARACVLLCLLYAVSIQTLISFGIAGASRAYAIAFVVLAGVFLGLRMGVIALCIYVATALACAYLIVSGVIEIDPVAAALSAPAIHWLSYFATLLVLAGVVLASTMYLLRSLSSSVHNLKQQIAETTVTRVALETSEAQYRLLADNVRDVIWTADLQLNYTYISPSIERMLGYSAQELLADSSLELATKESWDFVSRVLRENLELEAQQADPNRSRSFELEFVRRDRSTIWVEINVSFLRDEDGNPTGLVGVTRDISERRHAEKALEERVRSSTLLSELSGAFVNLPANDIDKTIERSLLRVVDVLDIERTAIWQLSDDGAHSRISHSQAGAGFEPIPTFVSEEAFPWLTAKTRRGEMTVFSRIDDLPNEAAHDKESYRAIGMKSGIVLPLVVGETLVGAVSFSWLRAERSFSDDLLQWLRLLSEVFANALQRKRAEEELAHHRDRLEELVEQRTAELEAAQAELVRKERLAALGQLTATVAHEIRNPLGTVRNAVFSIGDALERNETERIIRATGLAERNIQRCDRIITELLDFTRERKLRLRLTDMDSWLKSVIDEFEFPDGIECQCELHSAIHLEVDREHLRRAVVNVVANAVQALEEDGSTGNRLTVEIHATDARLDMRFIDVGPGIPEEILARIREPLFSTKDFGVGLGIPITENVMEDHGGGVEYASRVGTGTTVTLWLPRPDSEV